MFTYSLNSHDAEIQHIINSFKKQFQELNEKIKINIHDFKIFVYVFIMIYLRDISQQINNVDLLTHHIIQECHTCLCSVTRRKDLSFDIIY